MIAEAINAFGELVARSIAPHQIHDRDDTVSYLLPSGEIQTFDYEPDGRKHTAYNLDVLADHVADESAIWHCDEKVVLVVDADCDRPTKNTVVNPISDSAKFTALTEQAGRARSQKLFVQFIVQNLRDEMEQGSPGLLAQLRNLKFTTTDEEEGDVRQGRASMGKSVMQELSGADQLPETITLTVNRWAQFGIKAEIEVMLVVDLDERTICLKPLADSCVNANIKAHKELGALIKQVTKHNRVYHGKAF